jgi:cytidylate kinase
MKPLIIYVSGAPGSGKTTLAKLLSEQLYIPNVSSDLIHGGIEFSEPNHDRSVVVENVVVPLMIDMANRNISFVVDHVLYSDRAKETIIDKLRGVATVINIHTVAKDPIQRYVDRISQSELPDIIRRKDVLIERAGHHKKNLDKSAHKIDLNVPSLEVNTDDGYEPAFSEIVDFIDQYKNLS